MKYSATRIGYESNIHYYRGYEIELRDHVLHGYYGRYSLNSVKFGEDFHSLKEAKQWVDSYLSDNPQNEKSKSLQEEEIVMLREVYNSLK